MLLIRLQNDREIEIILKNSNEKVLFKKINELNLCDWHDAFFYENGKFEKLGDLSIKIDNENIS